MLNKDYILIIGTIPTINNIKDGMIQRELAIDSIFTGNHRIYVENIVPSISFLKFPKKFLKLYILENLKFNKIFKTNNVKIYKNITKKNLKVLCQNAKKIYFHSIYMANKFPPEYISEFKNKIIIDIHGCVVEELKLYNRDNNTIQQFQNIEEFAFNNVNTLIAVSNNMVNFYKSKYPKIKTNFIVLPIFSNKNMIKKNINKKLNIIYSGGAQKWQNIDLMIETISKITDNYKITILTPDIKYFNDKLLSHKIRDNVILKTAFGNELDNEYQTADLGFILRDDIIVNKVACPTKIIEYLLYGIVPVVLQPEIGDFNNMGYSYILNSDLVQGNIPDMKILEQMKTNNFKVINELIKQKQKGELLLKKIIKEN